MKKEEVFFLALNKSKKREIDGNLREEGLETLRRREKKDKRRN